MVIPAAPHRLAQRVAGVEERARHAVVGIAVDAVGADLLHQPRDRVPVRLALRAGAVVPGHGRQEHLHPAPVEILDRAFQSGQPARKIRGHVELVAIVDADVRIDIPEQDAVQPAEALLQIVQVAIHGVATGHRIIEIAVLHHHLRMHEVALRPLQFRAAVVGVVVADAGQVLAAPVAQLGDPVGRGGVDVDLPVADLGERPARRLARRRQVALGGDVRELVFGLRHVARRVIVVVGGRERIRCGVHGVVLSGRGIQVRPNCAANASRACAVVAGASRRKASTASRMGTDACAPRRVQASADAAQA